MSLFAEQCGCGSVTLPHLNSTRCGENYGMYEVLAFVQLSNMPTNIDTEEHIKVRSNWEDAQGSSTAYCEVTPMVKGYAPGGGDAVMTGEDQSADGAGEFVRYNPSTADVTFRGIKAEQAFNMSKLRCLAEMRDLGVYRFTADGRVVGISRSVTSGQTTTKYLDPIPVISAIMDDRQDGNRDEKDINTLHLQYPGGANNKTSAVTLIGLGGTTDPDTTTPWKGLDLLATGGTNA